MKLELNQYEIEITNNTNKILKTFLTQNNYSKTVLFYDSALKEYLSEFNNLDFDLSHPIGSGEKLKSFLNIEKLSTILVNNNFSRDCLIISFGGGATSDLVGFLSSIYLRGVDFLNIPTTLLSMVDASVGGKTGINFNKAKNIIGSFYNPKKVIVNLDYLNSLSKTELISGSAEIIKHCLIQNSSEFDKIKNFDLLTDNINQELIYESIKIKKEVVEKDFKEQGLRKILNFGHTIGHGIEAFLNFENQNISHGEAISFGMLLESRLAVNNGLLSRDCFIEIENILTKNRLLEKSIKINSSKVFELIRKDKKNSDNKINFSIVNKIGNCLIDQNFSDEEILDILKEYE